MRRLEFLEDRTLLNASMDLTAANGIFYSLDGGDPLKFEDLTVSVSGGVYTFSSNMDIDVAIELGTGLNFNQPTPRTVEVSGPVDYMTLNGSGQDDIIRLHGTNARTTINAGAGTGHIDLGDLLNPNGLGDLSAPITIVGPTTGEPDHLHVNLLDSGSAADTTYTFTPTTVTATNNFGGLTLSNTANMGRLVLALYGSNGVNNYIVQGTVVDASDPTLDIHGGSGASSRFVVDAPSRKTALALHGGPGDNTFDIYNTAGPAIGIRPGSGANTINLGDLGVTAGIGGGIAVLNDNGGAVDINVSNVFGATAGNWNLAMQGSDSPYAILTGFSSSSMLAYAPGEINSLSLYNASRAANSLTIDFSDGNPIPSASLLNSKLTYDGGADSLSTEASNLILKGGSFDTEVHKADFVGSGSIQLIGSSSSYFGYSGVSPNSVYDVVPATNYKFTGPNSSETSILVKEGANSDDTGNVQSLLISSPDLFTDTHVANKLNVTIDNSGVPGVSNVTVDYGSAVPVEKLVSLAVITNGSNDAANFNSLPPGVAASLSQGGGDDRATVFIPGTAGAVSTNLDGGPGNDELTIDAGGLAITPNNFAPGAAGGTVVSGAPTPGAPIIYANYEHVYVNNLPAVGPAVTAAAIKADPGQTLVNVVAGTFTTAAIGARAGDFTATIAWGDETSTAGWILQDAVDPSKFYVMGTHAYQWSATPLTTTITVASGGSAGERIINGVPVTFAAPPATASANGTAVVGNPSITVAGQLNPASDSGDSDADAITNIVQPNFFGLAGEAGALVFLYATPQGGSPILIGQTAADGNGAWSVTSNAALADGEYLIQARAQGAGGGPTSELTTIAANLVIDTVGPKINDARLDNFGGRVYVAFEDFGGVSNQGSGLVQPSLIDANNYRFSMLGSPVRGYRGAPQWLVTAVNVQPGTSLGPQFATILINNGRPFRGGQYQFNVQSADPSNPSGVRDTAGNALDGEFYGFFSSGNNIRGGSFSSRLGALHNRTFAPRTLIGPASPISPPGRPGQTMFVGRNVPRPRAAHRFASPRPAVRSAMAMVHPAGRPAMALAAARPRLAALRLR